MPDEVSKVPNMIKLMKRNNLDPSEIIYFDDLTQHINEMRDLGIESYLVGKDGITWELVSNSL